MAMITCPECKKKISENASNCPKCGYPLTPECVANIKKKEFTLQKGCRLGCLSIIGILVVFFLVIALLENTDTATPKTSEQIQQEKIEKAFSGWDGSHIELTKVIKKSMNDPDSYKHVETVHWATDDHLIVKTTFQEKNAFGGMIKNKVTAKVDLNGNIIEIISQEP